MDFPGPNALSKLICCSHLDVTSLPGTRRIAKLRALQLARGEGGSCALRDLAPLLLGKGRIEMEHERIGIGTQLSHDEVDTLSHQAGYERQVAGEAVELGN